MAERALPWVRTRRRRPMPPWLRFWLALFVFDVVFAVRDLLKAFDASGLDRALYLAAFGIMTVLACIAWRSVVVWWRRWRDDG